MDNQIMMTSLTIEKVRHLENITIPISSDGKLRHLLLTGKNGSGKTSVLDALAQWLQKMCKYISWSTRSELLQSFSYSYGVLPEFSCSFKAFSNSYLYGNFILAYFRDNRTFDAPASKHVVKITLRERYSIEEEPRKDFIKYLVDKKVSQSLYQTKNDTEKAQRLQAWFDSFEALLREIFDDPNLTLDFDVETFQFTIKEPKRVDFDFNTMSAGYAAILDIAVGIIMRMEAHTGGRFQFDMPGIVLIDELETHLHYELQRKVLPFLCRVFPNIQFIVTTHSAFILNSIENAVIYDLENQTLVPNGLNNVPYDGIIKGYFGASTLSEELRAKFERYKELVKKTPLTDDDLTEISRLQLYLDEIPDYLALELTTEYERLKLEFESREDL